MPDLIPYDEFGLFHENAAEYGLPYSGPPDVRRVDVEVSPGRKVSSLVWGTGPPELVLVHGGAQNAHTWDTVALDLDRPLVAVDLPGHGHSDGGPEGSLSVGGNGAISRSSWPSWPPTPAASWACRSVACRPLHWLRNRPSWSEPSSSSTSRPG